MNKCVNKCFDYRTFGKVKRKTYGKIEREKSMLQNCYMNFVSIKIRQMHMRAFHLHFLSNNKYTLDSLLITINYYYYYSLKHVLFVNLP